MPLRYGSRRLLLRSSRASGVRWISANWIAPIDEIIRVIISETERPRASSLLERAMDRAQPRL